MNEFIANVLKEALPTSTKQDEKYLAVALGYPVGWHVVRAPDKTDTELGKRWPSVDEQRNDDAHQGAQHQQGKTHGDLVEEKIL